mgnify:CR=1 FL=1
MSLGKFISFKGVTLSELLITMALLSGLMFFLVPLGSKFIHRNELDERVNALRNGIKFSQNQALLKGKTLLLSPLSEKKGWSSGMQLLVKDTLSTSSKDIIRQWQWHNGKGLELTWRGFNIKNALVFSSNLNASTLSGSFLISQNKQLKRKIIINRLGRMRIELVD